MSCCDDKKGSKKVKEWGNDSKSCRFNSSYIIVGVLLATVLIYRFIF